jgi:cytochrome d ubiquinol oxidase subunit II
MHIPLDYTTLRVIWWGLLGVLLIGFAIADGFDLGVASLLPFVARTDGERRMVINTIGATWEGNQVWFILGGGAIFAAWPFVYAVSFSGFYLAMLAVLASLILRPVGFKYRSKRPSAAWRSGWDWALFVGGFAPTLVFGVAIGNVLTGVPFRLDSDLRSTYEGTFFGLFTPFSLVCGLMSVAMLVMHGAAWLTMKAEKGVVRDRARRMGAAAAVAGIALFAVGFAFLAMTQIGFHMVGAAVPDGASNPTHSLTVQAAGGWLTNFRLYPWMALAPIIGFAGMGLALIGLLSAREAVAFGGSSAAIFGIISSVGLAMFPYILPSSIDARSSLTVWNASSSHMTLFIMLIATVIFLPLVLGYTAWVYKVLWGRTSEAELKTNPDLY